ncbi:MAG: 4Fe-4S cluster-binding domain-containing protein [Syntrophorhabdaceae bacterium]|nr:4Fe-4S cluster-binding domain-containing protein [Syntrophorhabdaceae bacterium]
MNPTEMPPDVVLKKSPFLAVKQLDENEVRVYSKLHGNLTSYGTEMIDVLGFFDIPASARAAVTGISGMCRCEPSVLIRELYEKHFLVEESRNVRDMFTEYVAMARRRNEIARVSKVTFLVSAKCNLACKGCYHTFYDFKSSHMTSEFADEVLRGLFPYLKKRGVPSLLISFLGYEPLLNFATMSRIYDRAVVMSEEYGIDTTFKVFTNAFNLKEDEYDWIVKNRSRLGFKVSLDGVRDDNDKRRVDHTGKGTFDRVVHNLKRIIATGVECDVLTVLSKANFSNIDQFVDEMAAIGIRNITANIFCGQSAQERKIELSEEERFEAIRRMDLATEKYGIEFDGEWKFAVVQMITGAHFTCPAGMRQMVFCADGAIHPCQRFAGTEITFGSYGDDFWERLGEGQCDSYARWIADLYDGVMERTKEEHADLTGWSCPFVPFIRGECLSKNIERDFNERLLEYYVTRPMNRIVAKSRIHC